MDQRRGTTAPIETLVSTPAYISQNIFSLSVYFCDTSNFKKIDNVVAHD